MYQRFIRNTSTFTGAIVHFREEVLLVEVEAGAFVTQVASPWKTVTTGEVLIFCLTREIYNEL